MSATKKSSAKKSEPAKKPVAKSASAKKAADKKSTPAKKASAGVEAPVEKVEKVEKKEYVRKPITVVKKTPKTPLKKPEAPTAFENHSQDMAFSFAERMKQRAREADKLAQESAPEVKLSRRPTTRTKGEQTLQFPAEDLEEFRKRLIMLRQEALGQSANLRTSALEQTDDRGSEDEDGSDAFMRLQNLNQVDSQNKTIQMIDEALGRIAEGKYGICEVCGQLIRKPRLLNLPFVHTCMECQTAMENPFGNR
ncbi:MAG: TraR/DksA family transcriptional regulator [Kiritimatiellia bacterium]